MKLRHGQLWRRLGLAIVSGILVASLAPSTIAAPLDGQDMRGDAQSADVDLSRSDSGAADSDASQDRAASDGTDASESADSADSTESADAATASSQEESADVRTYVYPGTSGPTRVHVITTQGSDAILLESKGVFGMIDGGEGQGAPDGSDPRYPLRPGTTPASKGDTQRILDYMSSQGVTSSNLAFYLGTHPHSDHIDNADDIIYRFHPQVIFSPEYSDAWISNPNALWDNQWVYDRMIAAASWAQRSYGAQLVQHVRNYDTHVQLGDMDVQLIPFDPQESYRRHPIRDANLLGWGSVVSAFGHRAFLAADLEIEGDLEDRIAAVVGHVDMLKAGHHGLATSNSESFMATLSPSMIIQTNPEWVTPDRLTTSVTVSGTASWAPTADLWDRARIPAVVGTFSESGISYNDLSAASWGHEYYQGVTPRAWWFQGARPQSTYGWWKSWSGNWYFFADHPYCATSQWVNDRGTWYWMDSTGVMATGWIYDGSSRYYLDDKGNPTAQGWQSVDGNWHYFVDGRASTGWLADRGTWYRLDESTGAMLTGWQKVDGRWYYMRSSGAVVTGWQSIDGSWYYFDGAGTMATGWIQDGGSWYYMNESGKMVSGWLRDGDAWYYMSSSGAMTVGWQNVGGSWYYFPGSGVMVTGWIQDGGSWYYMSETGAMVTGTQVIDGRRATFTASGRWTGYLP